MFQHQLLIQQSLSVLLLLLIFVSSCVVQFTQASSSISASSCPLYWRLQSIREEEQVYSNGGDVSFNYTNDMVNNWDSYNCDSLPNALFREKFVINGASLVDYQYNLVMLEKDIPTYCGSLNSDNIKRNETLELLEMFNNITLMGEYFVPYLESLLIEKNFTIERKYFIDGFDVILQNGGKKANLFELVNSFNYFMFCKDGNPYFKQFHTQILPSIVQQSAYKQVQTLEVIFGRNMEESCGMSTIPFFNRTLLCHCTSSTNSNSSEITFETLSFFECSSVYVKFWVPLSSHPSLKIIEILFHLFQMIVITIICFIPILRRNFKKWKDHMIARQNMTVIEKQKSQKKIKQVSPLVSSMSNIQVMKEIPTSSPSTTSLPMITEETTSENCSTPNQIVTSQSDQVVISFENVSTPVEVKPEETPRKEKNASSEQVRNSMKEHLQHELLRILCDMKLLTVVSLLMGVLCLFLNAVLHAAAYGDNGTAVYPTTTFLIASLAFICVYNIPLAGSFVEVLLKLDGKNKKVSIHGLIILFFASILLMILIIACILTAFTARIISGYIRVLSMPVAFIALIISWSIIFTYSLKIYFMLKKKRKIYFLQFKFSQYLIIILLALIYMIYEVVSELGFITELFVGETLWTIMFKHRIASYIMGGVFWGGAYVLFSSEHLDETYRPLMKKLGIIKAKRNLVDKSAQLFTACHSSK